MIFYGMLDNSFKEIVLDNFESLEDDELEEKVFDDGRFVCPHENMWGIAALRYDFDDDGKLKLSSAGFTSPPSERLTQPAKTNPNADLRGLWLFEREHRRQNLKMSFQSRIFAITKT